MPCVNCGLSNADCEAWSCPRLVTSRSVFEDCDCPSCEGHFVRNEPLPESEWYYRPGRYDMARLIRPLESDKSALLNFVSGVGRVKGAGDSPSRGSQ